MINDLMTPDLQTTVDIPEPEPGFSIEEYLSASRKALIDKAMELAGGNQSEAARLIGISPQRQCISF